MANCKGCHLVSAAATPRQKPVERLSHPDLGKGSQDLVTIAVQNAQRTLAHIWNRSLTPGRIRGWFGVSFGCRGAMAGLS